VSRRCHAAGQNEQERAGTVPLNRAKAEDEGERAGGPETLGKPMLYQLSYVRRIQRF